MPDLPADVEQHLADMSVGDFAALTARVRAPDTAEQLRAALSQHVSGDRVDAVMKVVNTSAFVGDDGQVDQAKVAQHLGSLFGDIHPLPAGHRWQDFGQGYPSPPMPGPGERGAAEAAKRFGGPTQPPTRGRSGSAEAERRYGRKEN